MAGQRQPTQRKIRTREHIIADRAVNAVERQVLLRGYTMEQIVHDYGYDAILFVYNDVGEAEQGCLFCQIKATESPNWVEDDQYLAFRLERSHLQHWLTEPMPVLLFVYEVTGDTTYWLYVQNYFENLGGFNLFQAGQTVTVRIPKAQTLSSSSVGYLATRVRHICQQIGGSIRHD